jgi:hypothetical protein
VTWSYSIALDRNANGIPNTADVLRMTAVVGPTLLARSVVISLGPLSKLLTWYNTTVITSQGTVTTGDQRSSSWIVINTDNVPGAGAVTISFFVTNSSLPNKYICGGNFDVYYPVVNVTSVRASGGSGASRATTMVGAGGCLPPLESAETMAALTAQTTIVSVRRQLNPYGTYFQQPVSGTPGAQLNLIARTVAIQYLHGYTTFVADNIAELKTFILEQGYTVGNFTCPAISDIKSVASPNSTSLGTQFTPVALAEFTGSAPLWTTFGVGVVGTPSGQRNPSILTGEWTALLIRFYSSC